MNASGAITSHTMTPQEAASPKASFTRRGWPKHLTCEEVSTAMERMKKAMLKDHAPDDAARFYADCAHILGAQAEYSRWPYGNPDRWNNRKPGNGRFPGFGIIRMFGQTHVQVSLRHPVKLNGTYGSREAAVSAVRTAVSIGTGASNTGER